MARGNNSGRGGNRGGHRGRGRGFTPARGRGRGGGNDPKDDRDFTIYDFLEDPSRGSSGVNSPRARGRGRGSGHSTPRGGAATPRSGFNTPRGGFNTPRGPFNNTRGGFNGFRGRGRGKPLYKPYEDFDVGMGRGSPPNGASRGRDRVGKNWESRIKAGVPLSKLLNEDRPLLRPIIFVRSELTATLFQEQEEILKPLSEDVANDENSHVPTADRVTRVFSGEADAEDESGDEEIEEIDFSQIGRLQAEVDAAAANGAKSEVTVSGERFTGFYIDKNPAAVRSVSAATTVEGPVLGDDDEEIIVYVAPHPRAGPITPPAEEQTTRITPPSISIPIDAPPTVTDPDTVETVPISEAGERLENASHLDDGKPSEAGSNRDGLSEDVPVTQVSQSKETVESLIGVAPDHSPETDPILAVNDIVDEASLYTSRTQTTTEVSVAPSFGEITFTNLKSTVTQRKFLRKIHPARTPRSLIKKNKPRRNKTLRGFGLYGANLAEAELQEERDYRKEERRLGDSDLDWGDESNEGDDVEDLSTGLGAMEIDSDIDPSSFLKSMSAEGSRPVTFDDIADIEQIRQEDDEGQSDEDDMDIMAEEEKMLVAQAGNSGSSDDDDGDDVSTDDEETPHRGFQARLQRMRNSTKGKRRAEAAPESSEDSDFDMELDETWADKDDAYRTQIKAILDKHPDILNRKETKSRKARDKLFVSIENGEFDFDEYEDLMGRPATRNKDKYKDLPEDLQEQWEKDRAKKAENKRKRDADRIALAADPLAIKKGGKKGLKDALRAARLDADVDVPHRVVDLVTLEQEIRRFLANIGGRKDMVLPPCDKATRAKIHELAGAFSLKSQSKGKGQSRYTTLTKTTKSGLNINEKKINRIMRQVSRDWAGPRSDRGGKGNAVSLNKHREGEEVGKAAPKIGESNLGFKMLASMGWTEGERIGLSGGLDAPLTAIMKKTKLGLGATL